MARPTQQEIDEWNARMEEPDPDDDMVIIELPNGTKVHRKYGQVKGYLKKQGLDLDDVEIEQEGSTGDPALDESGLGNDGKTSKAAQYFGRKDKKPGTP
jgi:hypothetical protein